jgi:biopolymer transport protein TolQ
MNPAEVAQSALPLTSSDLGLLTLFWQAHWIVKLVMLGLIIASIWVWAIVIDKLFLYARTRRAMDSFENAFWSGQSLEELYRALSAKPANSMGALFVAAMREWKRSFEGHAKSFAGLQTRVEKVMSVSIAREIERLEKQLLVLATVGSAGPFIGLFGTVWGIMRAFSDIAAKKEAGFDVVAPGISAALIATAFGIIVGIEAVMIYNYFSARLGRFAMEIKLMAEEFAELLRERAGKPADEKAAEAKASTESA